MNPHSHATANHFIIQRRHAQTDPARAPRPRTLSASPQPQPAHAQLHQAWGRETLWPTSLFNLMHFCLNCAQAGPRAIDPVPSCRGGEERRGHSGEEGVRMVLLAGIGLTWGAGWAPRP